MVARIAAQPTANGRRSSLVRGAFLSGTGGSSGASFNAAPSAQGFLRAFPDRNVPEEGALILDMAWIFPAAEMEAVGAVWGWEKPAGVVWGWEKPAGVVWGWEKPAGAAAKTPGAKKHINRIAAVNVKPNLLKCVLIRSSSF